MPIAPIELNGPDMVRVTAVLQELTSLFATAGFEAELREPYREYGTEIPGRDLKLTHPEVPAYYAAVKVSARTEGLRLIAQSATFLAPGLTVRTWANHTAEPAPSSEVLRFVQESFEGFRRDEKAHRRS